MQTEKRYASGTGAMVGLLAVVLVAGMITGRWLGQRKQKSASTVIGLSNKSVYLDESNRESFSLTRAKFHYGRYCAACHGENGRGNGEGLRPLTLRPRDFRSAHWRFPKSLASIRRVIREGIPGTPMPASANALSEEDISNLATFVLELAEPIAISAQPDSIASLAAAGFSAVIPSSAPRLSLVNMDSDTVLLADIIEGAAIVHFWGTACVQCIAHFPEVDQAAAQLRQSQITMISICTDATNEKDIASFAFDYPHIRFFVDPGGLAMSRFSTSVLPTMFLLDRNGIIIGRSSGHLDLTDLSPLVESVSTR